MSESESQPAESVLQQFRSHRGRTLAELSREQPVLVAFLRHGGCPFCRETLSELQRQRPAIEARGVGLALVHMDEESIAAPRSARYGLSDVDRFYDRECQLYRAFDLPTASLRQLLGPRVWLRGFVVAILKGHGFGRIRGDVFQMPGTFLLHRGCVLASHRPSTQAERPDLAGLMCEVPPSEATSET